MFISDWTDTGDYHNRTGENRLSGRIYKITYGDAKPSSGSDMTRLTVEQLVALNTHANEWFPRQARVEFSYRLVDGRGVGNARQLLRDQFNRETDVPRKLRALWTLYTIGGTDEAFLLPLLKSPNEHLRAWGIRHPRRALADRCAAARRRGGDGRDEIWTQQRPAPAVGGAEPTRSPAVARRADAVGRARIRRASSGWCWRRRCSGCRSVSGSPWPPGLRDAQGRRDRQEPPAHGLVRADSDRGDRSVGARVDWRRRASCAPPASTSPGASPRTSRPARVR